MKLSLFRKQRKKRKITAVLLAVVFLFNSLVIVAAGLLIGSYIKTANAELLKRELASSFKYRPRDTEVLSKINLASFWGKPVRIPLPSKNPDGIPGGDRDYVFVYPPKLVNKNASIPLRTVYFSSGREIDRESVEYVRNMEEYVNSIGRNNEILVEEIRRTIKNVQRNDRSIIMSFIEEAKAEGIDLNPLLAAEDGLDLSTILESDDPKVQQILILLLLLIILSEYMGGALVTDKEQCLIEGGEWIYDECFNYDKDYCEDSGGSWEEFENECYASLETCESTKDFCYDYEDPVWSCGCPEDQCLDEWGECVDASDSRKAMCEDSGGTWRTFFSFLDLCLEGCGMTEDKCNEDYYGGSTGSWWQSGSKLTLVDSLEGCECPEGECVAAAGECIKDEDRDKDQDGDGVKNEDDRCPDTPEGEAVNTIEGDENMGCSCEQLEQKGRIKTRECPADQCEGDYWVEYPESGEDECTAGIVTEYSCSPLSRRPDEECREMNEEYDEEEEGGEEGGDQGGDQGQQGQDDQQQQQGGGPTGPGGPTDTEKKDDKDKDKENGTIANPYKLESNQFKKVCGENKYVLWWSKPGGVEKSNKGKDLKKIGVDYKGSSPYFKVPTCEELAKCHCCCNTCFSRRSFSFVCNKAEACFSEKSVCNDNSGDGTCSKNCACSKCEKECENYKKNEHKEMFNRDCKCGSILDTFSIPLPPLPSPGCKDSSDETKNCKIVLFESKSGWSYNLDKKNDKAVANTVKEVGNKDLLVSFGGNDTKEDEASVGKLEQKEGTCCKCTSGDEARKGPKGKADPPTDEEIKKAGGKVGSTGVNQIRNDIKNILGNNAESKDLIGKVDDVLNRKNQQAADAMRKKLGELVNSGKINKNKANGIISNVSNLLKAGQSSSCTGGACTPVPTITPF